jgi:pimeloyl-ACP methyl ester carboxylesterase
MKHSQRSPAVLHRAKAGVRHTALKLHTSLCIITSLQTRREVVIVFKTGLFIASLALASAAYAAPLQTKPCRVKGFEGEVQCGSVQRALDPKAAAGKKIEVHFVVLPALARNKLPDPLFFLAGGPGQSAINLAAQVKPLFRRLNNRRDIVFVDQRGTGKSANLACPMNPKDRLKPLSELLAPEATAQQTALCLDALAKREHGNFNAYNTTIAMQDLDAVREALGYAQINLAGGSYGTRAALEYQRLFPKNVRRSVIDGVAPPDMVLPESFGVDAKASLELMFAGCAKDATCNKRYPDLKAQFEKLMASLPAKTRLAHPVTGRSEEVTITRDMISGWLRLPLYAPQFAQALPFAISQAAAGEFTPFAGLGSALLGGESSALAWGMHFAVVCAEDFPRIAAKTDAAAPDVMMKLYTSACTKLKVAPTDAAFYTMPPAQSATLVLSGGADPVTPPRHGERAAKALGAKAKHVVVPEAGHGVISIGCMRDVLFRFYSAETDAEALAVDASCVTKIPRPAVFVPFDTQATELSK